MAGAPRVPSADFQTGEVHMPKTQSHSPFPRRAGGLSHAGSVALGIALLGCAAVLLMLFGARFGLWEPLAGFQLYRSYFAPISYIVFGLALAALLLHGVRRDWRGGLLAGVALFIGAAMLAPQVLAMLDPPRRAPPIHDITTNTETPPQFLVLDDSRAGASNSLTYGGAAVAAMQQESYPEIAPIQTNLSGPGAFDRALEIAQDMGWQIIDVQNDALRFEATAHTSVFYFADDVVVVVTPQSAGSRVDIRSVSRVGRSDQGVNAARIHAFVEAFGS